MEQTEGEVLELSWADERLQEYVYRAVNEVYDERGQFVLPIHVVSAILNSEEYYGDFYMSVVDYAKLVQVRREMTEVVPESPFIRYEGVTLSDALDTVFGALEKIGAKMNRKVDADVFLYYLYEKKQAELMKCVVRAEDFVATLRFEEYSMEELQVMRSVVEMSMVTADLEEFMSGFLNKNTDEEAENVFPEGKRKAEDLVSQFAFLGLKEVKRQEGRVFVGREEEMKRAVQVLCRLDKGNVLFVGESGVGKTEMVRGLAAAIEEREGIPERIGECSVVELNVANVIGNAQFLGEMEKKLTGLFDALSSTRDIILFVDDMHLLLGAGRTEKNAIDAAAVLRPYLQEGKIRMIGCTTFEEYKKNIQLNKPFDTCFTKVEIGEPSADEAVRIVKGIKGRYESFHNVEFEDDVIEFIVRQSAKYISDRFLPAKAVDLMDEIGAKCEMLSKEKATIEDVKEALSKVCNVSILSDGEEERARIENIEEEICGEVFGQEEAVRGVSEAVLMSFAGLQDDGKPMASLLFVGPTGVGKTETAKVLAKKLGVAFLKFDMSEYAEKHTVSKLIGSPAGYVGYEEGGLLTDAVRKSPHCVLLLDEIEKAHADIYNILLQIMDYATLTDNRGQKADFRHVVLIMTTNAGARYAGKANSGFVKKTSAGEAMMEEVKRTFSPEFINRLTAINVFKDMDREMAMRILGKKIGNLEGKLSAKGVTLNLTEDARALMLEKGYSVEYGGRNIERTVNEMLTKMLMREMLFGCLKGGGEARITVKEGELKVERE